MPHLGDRIGPFELVERIRRGRRTSLYHGVRKDSSTRLAREVVLRVGETEGDPEVLELLREEYETLRRLEDERIPRPVALYAGSGALALESIRGVSLRETLALVESGKLDLDAATSLDILIELAYALRHAHAIVREEGRIVHGTLAPEVVWLTATGKVYLLGFADPDPVHAWPQAPEQQQGVQDILTDQWLLGALGLELLRHAPEVLDQARGASVDQAWDLIRAQWPAATRILSRLLSEDSGGRYEAEERLIKDLLAVSRTLGGASRRAEVGARTIQMSATHDPPEPGMPKREPRQTASRVADPDAVAPPPTWPVGGRPRIDEPRVEVPRAEPRRPEPRPEPRVRTEEPTRSQPRPAFAVPLAAHPSEKPAFAEIPTPVILIPEPARAQPIGLRVPAPPPPEQSSTTDEGTPAAEPLPEVAEASAAVATLPEADAEPTTGPAFLLPPMPDAPVLLTRSTEPSVLSAHVEIDTSDPDWEATGEFGPPTSHIADARPGLEHTPVRSEGPALEDELPAHEPSALDEPPVAPPADPVPDKWVYAALGVFGAVVTMIVLWRLV